MASHSDAATIPGALRTSIRFSRLHWVRPLVDAVAHDFPSVAGLFAGNPASPGDWTSTIARVQQAPHQREALAASLLAQLSRRGAPQRAVDAAAQLARPDAVVVITGQQAGLFGGPLYTLLKAVTAVQLARGASARHGVPVVPVFWVEGDDHDWNEIRNVAVLDRDNTLATIEAPNVPGAGEQPVGALVFDDGIVDVVDRIAAALAPTEFTESLVAQLRKHYRPGATPVTACAGWLDDLLGDEGLVVFESNDVAARRLAARVVQYELAHPCDTARLAREAADRMNDAGHAPQITPADDLVCLFRIDEQAGRLPIRCRDGKVTVGDHEVALEQLQAEAAEHPERYSPNVLLRPVVQDAIFPTVCYVAGPSELAYHAQLDPVYRALGIERPLVAARGSATLVDSTAARFLDKYDVPFESLQAQDESALNRLLESQLPPALDAAFDALEVHIAESTATLKAAATAVDPTLAGAVDTTAARMRETVKHLQGKIVQASKKKDETVRRQFTRTQALVFPDGKPQERLLGVPFFVNRYGLELGARLIETLPVEAAEHYVLAP